MNGGKQTTGRLGRVERVSLAGELLSDACGLVLIHVPLFVFREFSRMLAKWRTQRSALQLEDLMIKTTGLRDALRRFPVRL